MGPFACTGCPVGARSIPRGRRLLQGLPWPGPGAVPTSCWCCGGADFPTHGGDPQACPWCRGSHGDTCVSCHTILHHRGQCRWNSGSHHSYSLPAPGSPTLCPDCWWKWVCQMQSNPRWRRRAVALSDDLRQQPKSAATRCLLGAGSALPRSLSSQPKLRRVRRWLLAVLQHAGSCPMPELHRAIAERYSEQDAGTCSSLLVRAARALQAEGRAVFRDPELILLPA